MGYEDDDRVSRGYEVDLLSQKSFQVKAFTRYRADRTGDVHASLGFGLGGF